MTGKSGIPKYFSKNYGFLETRRMNRLFRGIEKGAYLDENSLEDLVRSLLFGLVLASEDDRKELIEYAKYVVSYVERNGYEDCLGIYYKKLKERLEKSF